MRSLPWNARLFILGTYLIGFVSVVTAILLPFPKDARAGFEEFIAFLILSIAFSWKTLRILPKRHSNAGSVSVGFVIIYAAMLRFGPEAAVLVGVVTALSASLKARHLWYQILFNAALNATHSLVAGLAFLFLNRGQLPLDGTGSISALVASVLCSFFINSGAVAMVISLCTGGKFARQWIDNFLFLGPGYFIGGMISVGLVGMLDGRLPVAYLWLMPVIAITYLAFRTYLDRTDALADSQQQLTDLYLATTRSLALAVDAKDRYTHQHIIRVQKYAMAIAKHMGLTANELAAMEIGALLHDIGKMGVPESVLLKPGRLTDEEFDQIKQHPQIGAEILEPVPFPWPVVPMVKHHHERWDGTGYPDGLRGEEIPLSARILAVADVYDALTSDRSYRGAWTHERATAEIVRQAGTQFDPRVVDSFVQVIDEVAATTAPVFLPVTEPVPPLVGSQPALARNDESLPLFANRNEGLITTGPSSSVR
ncbi:MAG: HD domain-containing protein [Capsulimonadales bacterium]|nr:HD domain-containing protein [Capsulimonadales bacterium]